MWGRNGEENTFPSDIQAERANTAFSLMQQFHYEGKNIFSCVVRMKCCVCAQNILKESVQVQCEQKLQSPYY